MPSRRGLVKACFRVKLKFPYDVVTARVDLKSNWPIAVWQIKKMDVAFSLLCELLHSY